MRNHTISFIGAGNMARSLIGGLIAGNWTAEHIRVSDPDTRQLEIIRQQYPRVFVTENNQLNVSVSDVVLFAVKPHALKIVAQELAKPLSKRNVLIMSIVAGVRSNDILRWLDSEFALVRCMPNTPALVGSAATGLYANKRVTPEQRDIAETVLRAVGLTLWIDDEVQLDAVTALSGSGPAYFLLIMEAMESAGLKLGISAEAARLLILQTAFGTAKLALESEDNVATLRAHVTSKGGTTERAIAYLEKKEFHSLIENALAEAATRSKEIADEWGKE